MGQKDMAHSNATCGCFHIDTLATGLQLTMPSLLYGPPWRLRRLLQSLSQHGTSNVRCRGGTYNRVYVYPMKGRPVSSPICVGCGGDMAFARAAATSGLSGTFSSSSVGKYLV